jgi:hypothetical protein
LKAEAEKRRVQGSVFQIEAIPFLAFRGARIWFGIAPINDRSGFEYKALASKIKSNPPADFGDFLPHQKQNWLLSFFAAGTISSLPFAPACWRSYSSGTAYRLGWDSGRAKKYASFLDFAEFLKDYFLFCWPEGKGDGTWALNQTRVNEYLKRRG